MDFSPNGGGYFFNRAGFGVFWSKAISKSTAESAFADSVNCSDNAITTQTASARNDSTSCHCEVPEARQHIRHWSITSCHCEERSDVAIAKPLKCDSKHKKAAFTLAEVLITLAIIGIVAALTIPTLVQNYQERAWNTASQVFQRKLGEALRVMNVQGTLAGYTTTEAFVDELSKHIKVTRICDNDDITTCFADTVTWGDEEVDMSKVKKAKNFGQEDWDTNTVAVQFANGVNGIIAYNPDCRQNQFSNDVITVGENGISTDCLAILYDVDGFKNPVASLGGSNCAIELSDGTCFTAPFYPSEVTKAECEQLVADGYPIKECGYEHEYWAGAVKACKDMGSSLPSQEQLDQLAKDLYPGTTISSTLYEYSYGDRDNDLAMEWNFISSPSSAFSLCSSEEYSKRNVYRRYFGSTYTGRDDYISRSSSNLQAVCLAE